ncbi:MAG TPA: hypothetical protein H9889_00940, partial [Candidatus Ignatzschineria merdigallinarum]|nr:hypothetical protein [Candidatus Ignatzschineria merdigallinarum]
MSLNLDKNTIKTDDEAADQCCSKVDNRSDVAQAPHDHDHDHDHDHGHSHEGDSCCALPEEDHDAKKSDVPAGYTQDILYI